MDVGCHKGEILDLILKYAPNGRHYAFEPIPYLFQHLQDKYGHMEAIDLHSCALSDHEGVVPFQLVKNAPAFSGIKRRKYHIADPEIEEIKVELRKADNLISPEEKIDFIKIDVEGGELDVMKGATRILKNKPIVLFECGKGSSDVYGSGPQEIYSFITENAGLELFTLEDFLKNRKGMSRKDFTRYFETSEEYYFVAGPAK